ncbi:SDR family NAD(P)-dependent oxidoreductase [Aureimonas leprariae]|uniref:SDR family oxidoreductase n=1 Tax=Plantimonas leprariae TaxID=2615207 RepID=A0A7V7TV81_9HYPH|nr:SDR family oxidoreductase [Aureimonas leprariae]KAB0677722.1 SDR family oxidoreductase [Aureimonas leprariae]
MPTKRFQVDGQVAVVTGGGRGIGLASAEALAEAGARLVLIEPQADAGEAGRAALEAKGFEAEALVGDVTSSARMTEIADMLAARGTPATILVNNAGIGETGFSSQDVEDAHWLRTMNVNVNGVFWCSRAFGRHMLAAKRGAIVNLGSMSGTICNRPQPQTPYNVSKAAVHHMTRSMAAEWAPHGVRVNAVAPTYIETPMVLANPANADRIPIWLNDTPMGRMGQAEEVANAVLFLASDAASLITGAIVPVDGGFTCW